MEKYIKKERRGKAMKEGIDMKGAKVFTTVILLGLSLFTALLLESRMGAGFIGELVAVLIGVILSLGLLFGLWTDADWTYSLATVIFAAALGNLLFLFVSTKAFLVFAFGLIVNIAGLVICLVSVTDHLEYTGLETYEMSEKSKKTKRKKRRR